MTSIKAPGKAVISVENMGVSYWVKKGPFKRKRFWALNDLSFDLHPGDSLGVVGRNGSGKSTLLRLLAGVMSPDRGKVTNHSARVSLLSLQLGFVPHLSGRQNAILSGLFLGLRRKEIEEKMDDIIAFSELEEFIEVWLELRRKDGTIEKLYNYWILGRDDGAKEARWSVIRNVFGWVD